MRSIVLLMSLVLIPTLANGRKVDLRYSRTAKIHVCEKDRQGCAHKIEVDEKEYLIDPVTTEAKEALKDTVGACQFHKMETLERGSLIGFGVTETGHFPNPTAEFDVFKVFYMSFNLPK